MTRRDGYEFDTFDLLALADGQLDRDPHYKAALEEALAHDPVLAARARIYRSQTEALRCRLDPRLAEPIPGRLLRSLEQPRGSHWWSFPRVAAVVVLMAAASAAGWTAGRYDHPAEPWMIHAAAEAELDWTRPGGLASGTVAGAREDASLPGWLRREIAFSMEIPDLSALGFTLVGRRAVEIAGTRAVRLDYATRDGRAFNLFLRPRWPDTDPGLQVAERDGVTFAYWTDGPVAGGVATRLSRSETVAVADALRRGLRGNGTESEARPAPRIPDLPSLPLVPPPAEPSPDASEPRTKAQPISNAVR